MKKFLLIVALALCGFATTNSLQAQTTTSMDRPLVWGASPFQDSLWAIDTSIAWNAIVYRIAPSLPSFTITGITGLATDPTTGITYAILKVSAVSGRVLATIDLPSGVCTQVGNLGDNFSTLTFREDGQLFGVTGDGATVPETLYLIDKATGTKTLAAALGGGADGEVICYNPSDDFFYHWSGNGTVVYEKVMSVAPYTVTNIPTTGTASGETFGAMYLSPTSFLRSTISSNFNRHSTTGAYSATFGGNPDDLRGLVMLPYFTASDDTICANESVTIMGGGHQLLTHYYYHWGDGDIDSIANVNGVLTNGTHMYSAPGNYTVYVESFNGSGGDTIYSYTVQVNNIPVVAISGMTTICSGDSVTLTGTSGGTSQWYMNGLMIPGATTNTYSTNVAGVYNMIKTNLNGCSDSASVGATLIIGTYPVVTLGNDTAVCDMYTLDAGNAGSAYSWSNGDSTQTSMVMTSGAVSVAVTNTDGCTSNDTVNVTINTSPVVTLGPDTTACGSVTIDGGSFPGGSYLWCNGSTTQMTTFTTSGPCALMVLDSNGCMGIDTIDITINPNPMVMLGPDVQSCTNVVITADTALLGAGSFLWCDSTTNHFYFFTNSGTCDLTFTDLNGCVGRDTITVTIYGVPTVTATASDLGPCTDDADVALSGSPAGGLFTGSSVTGNNFDPSIGAGTYPVIYSYVDTNGCTNADTLSIVVDACVGIIENATSSVSIYPNPTNGVLNIQLAQNNSVVEVYDVLGNLVSANRYSNAGTVQVDLSNQPNGVYFVRINSNETRRVVLQK